MKIVTFGDGPLLKWHVFFKKTEIDMINKQNIIVKLLEYVPSSITVLFGSHEGLYRNVPNVRNRYFELTSNRDVAEHARILRRLSQLYLDL